MSHIDGSGRLCRKIIIQHFTYNLISLPSIQAYRNNVLHLMPFAKINNM